MIEAKNVVYDYPGKRALHGVSVSVPSGSITALVGPNGAGKSTLMRLMAALDQPLAGTITVDGVDTRQDPRRVHERLGYLPDFFGLYDELSVERCLWFAARSRGVKPGEARAAVDRACRQVGLERRMGDKARSLSRGLKQRLAIGQAIVHQPRILLLDEPASGLDPDARRELSKLFIELRDAGMTLLVSSHILAELEDYSTSMIIIKEGRLSGQGAVEEEAAKSESLGARLRITLAEPHEGFAAAIEALEGVIIEEARGTDVIVRVAGAMAERAALVRALVQAGVPVAGVTEAKRTLAEIYEAETGGEQGR